MSVAIYRDPSRATQERVADLLARMKLEEKIGQLCQVDIGEATPEELVLGKHIGSFASVGDLELLNRLQHLALHQTRLGIPLLFGCDAVHGHALSSGATVFPTQLALSCSWNVELARSVAEITAKEMAVTGQRQTFSPVLCLPRDLRWGRVDETFGEDPHLIAELAAGMILGYQRDSLRAAPSVLACAKHYAGYGDTLGGRDSSESDHSRRKMLSLFLPPFEKAVRAGCLSVMIAYHAIDGVPCSANRWLLTEVLKRGWGFKGFSQTDFNNVGWMVSLMHVAEDIDAAIVLALDAGTDMLNNTAAIVDRAPELVRSGRIQESVIDEACGRVLSVKFDLGLFDSPEKCFAHPERVSVTLGCSEHRHAALEVARQSVVLLKNDGILPLNRDRLSSISVIGPNADDIYAQLGDWSFERARGEGHPRAGIVTVLDGIRQWCGSSCEVLYERGCDNLPEDLGHLESIAPLMSYPAAVHRRHPVDLSAVRRVAEQGDVVVAVVGDTVALNGELRDRADLCLDLDQRELLEAIKVSGKPLVVVLICGKPLTIPRLTENANAVLCAWNPGMEGGRAIAEILFGSVNPSAKLTLSWPAHMGQQPVFYNQLPGWHGGRFVDMRSRPAWPFGHGLSYTSFEYANLRTDGVCFTETDTIEVSVDVRNTGERAGTEIVQLYVNDLVSSVTTPLKQLKCFARVHLEAGEARSVVLKLPVADLWLIDAACEKIVESGTFEIMVGPCSSDDTLLRTLIRVEGS